MTIENENFRWDYFGDDATLAFDFDNLVKKDTDLKVYLDGVLKIIATDYTVIGAGTKNGSVNFLVAPANGVAVAIIRETEEDQIVAYPEGGPFPAKSHEGAMDKLTIIAQELAGALERSLKFNPFSLIKDIFIDDPVADSILVYSSDAQTVGNGPNVQEILDIETNAAQSAQEAADSATAALASENAAAASFLDFDTRYLGAKAADPALDNQGGALIDGALYWNTTTAKLKVYDLTNLQWLDTTDPQPRTMIIVTDDLDISAVGYPPNAFFQVRPVAEAQVLITIPDATTAAFLDGYDASFHLDLPGSIFITTPSTPPVTTIDGADDLVISEQEATVTLIASTTTGDYQISQDSRPKEGAGITLFATTFADPVLAGYVVAVTDNDDVRYDDPAVTVTTPVISNAAVDRATAELTSQFIADAGVVGDLLDDDMVLTVVSNITPANAKTAQFFSSLYLAVSPYGGANETLIKETATSGVITSVAAEQNLLFSNVTLDIGPTDRLVIKTWGFKTTAGGIDPAVEFPVGGKLPADVPARVKVPQSQSSISHNATIGIQGGGSTERYHMTQLQHDTQPGIKGTDIASAATIVIPVDGSYFELTGSVTVADMTVADDRAFVMKVVDGTTFTDSASLTTESGSDLVVAAGGIIMVQSTAADTVQITKVPSGSTTVTVATTSGTSVDIDGIPATATIIHVLWDGLTTDNTQPDMFQLKDSGGPELTGYTCEFHNNNAGSSANTTGFLHSGNNMASTNGQATLIKKGGANTWSWSGKETRSSVVGYAIGRKLLSDVLTGLRLTTLAGTGNYTGGSLTIIHNG